MHVQDSCTPLHGAVEEGHLEVVQALLAAGANKEAALSVGGPWVVHGCEFRAQDHGLGSRVRG